MVKVKINRHFNAGRVDIGHMFADDEGYVAEGTCAAVQFIVGFEEVWLTRDEAVEVAHALLDAARDT